jgi:hypothetical protein
LSAFFPIIVHIDINMAVILLAVSIHYITISPYISYCHTTY